MNCSTINLVILCVCVRVDKGSIREGLERGRRGQGSERGRRRGREREKEMEGEGGEGGRGSDVFEVEGLESGR